MGDINEMQDEVECIAENMKAREMERLKAWEASLSALSPLEREKMLEKKEKEARARERRELIGVWKVKGIPERYWNASRDTLIIKTPEQKRAVNTVFEKAWKENLFVHGGSGTGKTHIAMSLVKDGAKYRRMYDIDLEVKDKSVNKKALFDSLGACRLLILDEVGWQADSDYQRAFMLEIINRRYDNLKPTLMFTNCTPEEFANTYGKAVLDRLRPVVVKFDWESYRAHEEFPQEDLF